MRVGLFIQIRVCVSLSSCHCVYMCCSDSLHISACMCVAPFLSIRVCASLSFYQCVYACRSLHISVCMCVTLFLSVRACVPLSPYLAIPAAALANAQTLSLSSSYKPHQSHHRLISLTPICLSPHLTPSLPPCCHLAAPPPLFFDTHMYAYTCTHVYTRTHARKLELYHSALPPFCHSITSKSPWPI